MALSLNCAFWHCGKASSRHSGAKGAHGAHLWGEHSATAELVALRAHGFVFIRIVRETLILGSARGVNVVLAAPLHFAELAHCVVVETAPLDRFAPEMIVSATHRVVCLVE